MPTDYAAIMLADFKRRDNLQQVTLTNGVTGSQTADVDAVNRSLSYQQASFGAPLGIEPTDQRFLLGAESLGTVTPQRGDTIETADGTKWTIVIVTAYSMGDTVIYFEAVSRKQP